MIRMITMALTNKKLKIRLIIIIKILANQLINWTPKKLKFSLIETCMEKIPLISNQNQLSHQRLKTILIH